MKLYLIHISDAAMDHLKRLEGVEVLDSAVNHYPDPWKKPDHDVIVRTKFSQERMVELLYASDWSVKVKHVKAETLGEARIKIARSESPA